MDALCDNPIEHGQVIEPFAPVCPVLRVYPAFWINGVTMRRDALPSAAPTIAEP